MAVCEKTFRLYTQAPYARDIVPIEPRVAVTADTAKLFDCTRDAVRHPRETKGLDYQVTTEVTSACCGSNGSCG